MPNWAQLSLLDLFYSVITLIGENADFVALELVAGSGQWVIYNLITSSKQQISYVGETIEEE